MTCDALCQDWQCVALFRIDVADDLLLFVVHQDVVVVLAQFRSKVWRFVRKELVIWLGKYFAKLTVPGLSISYFPTHQQTKIRPRLYSKGNNLPTVPYPLPQMGSPLIPTCSFLSLCRSFSWWPVWPDWMIYWTLGKILKPLAKINLPRYPTFLGNFRKVSKSIIFLVK